MTGDKTWVSYKTTEITHQSLKLDHSQSSPKLQHVNTHHMKSDGAHILKQKGWFFIYSFKPRGETIDSKETQSDASPTLRFHANQTIQLV